MAWFGNVHAPCVPEDREHGLVDTLFLTACPWTLARRNLRLDVRPRSLHGLLVLVVAPGGDLARKPRGWALNAACAAIWGRRANARVRELAPHAGYDAIDARVCHSGYMRVFRGLCRPLRNTMPTLSLAGLGNQTGRRACHF